MLKKTCAILVLALLAAAAASAQTQTLKLEPQEGELRPGTRVRVDDGTCPTGQIKEVTVTHRKAAGTGVPRPGATHLRRCVKR